MARSPRATVESLAGALADGATIDWAAAGAGAGAQAEVIRQLRAVAGLRVEPQERAYGRSWLQRLVATAYVMGVVLAALKVLLALAVAPAALTGVTGPLRLFGFNLVVFGVGGLLLIGGGTRDRRLQLLGALYVIMASAFAAPFYRWVSEPFVLLADVFERCTAESFFAAGLGLFAWAFPREPRQAGLRRAAGALAVFAVGLGWVLLLMSLLAALPGWSAEPSWVGPLLRAFDREAPESWYWPILAVTSLAAVGVGALKLRADTEDGRARARRFVGALAFGFAPLFFAVVATPFVPALRDPSRRQLVDLVVYLGLASIVPTTAYAVAVRRVMTLEFVVRATLQYALARTAIWAAILAPVTYLVLDVFLHRALTVLQYVESREPGLLLAVSATGLVALTFRPQLAQAVDRWFLREPLDAAGAMAGLELDLRSRETLREVAQRLAAHLTAAVHAGHAEVWLVAEDGATLMSAGGDGPAIRVDAVLVSLVQSTGQPLQLDPRTGVARLLPDDDQDWLSEVDGRVVAPLLGASGTLLGLAVLGDSQNALPYTPAHAALITSMCGHAALQLENRALRQGRPTADEAPTRAAGGIRWQDEPAAWCQACGTLAPTETRRCRCGGVTKPADLPLFVHAKFRLQRQLGAGGAGVVYLATDLALDRQVAIKTLPAVRRGFAARLRREARAMAAVRHPNLATIYGVEEWRDTPLLVVEYLDGGTLLDLLASGPLGVDEALDLGITLADVLDRVHGSGVLHRDIKPSNIGFTHDGVAKLLDFGLAAMLDRSVVAVEADAPARRAVIDLALREHELAASSTLTVTNHIVGTPLYLSPEALDGAAPHEGADLWGLGMVLHEAIAGRHPFGGRRVSEVVEAIRRDAVPDVRHDRPDCPAEVAAFLAAALAPNPARRPPSAAEFRAALRALRARLDASQ